jgi:hypothetical protein
MSDYEACMADAARPLPVRREPSDPEMLRSLAELFNQISDPKVEYRIQRGFANRARPGSPGQTQAENAADDALLRIAMLVRTWAHDYPAPWMQPGAWGEWCPHGVQIVEADPDTTDPEGYPVGRVVDPWPCSAYDCTRAGYERAQAEEIDAYYDDLSLEVYGA